MASALGADGMGMSPSKGPAQGRPTVSKNDSNPAGVISE